MELLSKNLTYDLHFGPIIIIDVGFTTIAEAKCIYTLGTNPSLTVYIGSAGLNIQITLEERDKVWKK